MKDILGNSIKVGNFIAYGVRSGNSGDLRIAKVTGFSKDGGVKARRVVGCCGEIWGLSIAASTIYTLENIVVLADNMIPDEIKKLYL